MKIPNQDVKPGTLDRCQITGSKNLFEAIDLGFQPSAGALLTREGLNQPETRYPLRLMICPESGLGQLDYVVDSNVLFSDTNYVYRTGISEPLRQHLKLLTEEITEKLQLPKKSFCIDVGSNDGTLLSSFRDQGMHTLGVEPTNMAKTARKENKINTIQAFFNQSVAKDIVKKYGRAKVITFTNVFAHVSSLGEVMRGLKNLLDKQGVVVSESQYLLDVFEGNQFDQIYHEHVRIYSLKSLVKLFPYYGMEVFDASRVKTREGSIRIYAGWKGQHPISAEVKKLLQAEEKAGLFTPTAWSKFRSRVEKSREQFLELAYTVQKKGLKLVADSCPTRGVVVMNYYGLNTSLVPYIAQLPGTEKVGKYMAGTYNPIVSNEILLKEKPEYVLILAWHFADFIIKNWRAKGLKSKFIVPLPEFRIIE
ncbi:MAG: class I SAM-dependent methyltransferase [Candidatus Pacebacteria bacterium]|nr:class I SAM-dependent methyltransferase [Candidatus Paceibacterota bacterium]MBP9832177.1 class I SAM-dependent methyltransferase [Candidatus Paceibacterota bacterium]